MQTPSGLEKEGEDVARYPSMIEDLVEASKDKWKEFFHIDTQNEITKQVL